MRIRTSTTIERPVDEVFSYVSDPRNDPEWCGHVQSCEQRSGHGPAEGARYRAMHDPRPGKAVPFDIEILELDPPRHMATLEEDFAARLRVRYELEPLDAHRTRITQTTELRNKGWWKLLLPASYLGIRANLPKQFRALKARLETGAAAERGER